MFFHDHEEEEENAVRKLENVVDMMTDMAHIRRNTHTTSQKSQKRTMEISPALIKEAIEAFDLFDKKKLHGLDRDELGAVFRAMGQNPSDCELDDIMKNCKLNAEGIIERPEFEKMIVQFMKPKWQVEEELKDAFRLFDSDCSGQLDTAKVQQTMKKFGEPLSHRQAKELLTLMDTNQDGVVDVNEFVTFLSEVDKPDFFRTHYPTCNARRGSLC